MKTKNRFFSIALILVMLVALVPTAVFAEDAITEDSEVLNEETSIDNEPEFKEEAEADDNLALSDTDISIDASEVVEEVLDDNVLESETVEETNEGSVVSDTNEAEAEAETETIRTVFPDEAIAKKVASYFGLSINDELPVNDLWRMKSLNISNSKITTFKGIERLTGLTSIMFVDCTIDDLSTLKLKDLKLETLGFRGAKSSKGGPFDLSSWNSEGVSVSSEFNMSTTQLDYPSFNACIAKMKLSGEVNLASTRLTSFAAINTSAFSNVKTLTLSSNEASDISKLNTENLQSLEILTLHGTGISSFEGWDTKGLTSLKRLNVNNARINNDTLSTMKNVFELQKLTLIDINNNYTNNSSSNSVSDLSNLEELTAKFPNVKFMAQAQEVIIEADKDLQNNTVTVKNPIKWLDGSSNGFKYSSISNNGNVELDGKDATITWETNKESGEETFAFSQVNENQTIALTGKATVKYKTPYTVTYTDGVDNEEVFKDQVYDNLTAGDKTPEFNGIPKRAGYEFIGWEPEVAEKVTEDATYVAQWAKLYTVTYKSNGGEQPDISFTVAEGEPTPPYEYIDSDGNTLTEPTRKGYEFIGWEAEVAEATHRISDGEIISLSLSLFSDVEANNLPSVFNIADIVTEDVIYAAQWEINTFTATLELNGGTGINKITADYNQTFSRPADPTRAGYVFAGWFVDKELTVEYNFNTPVTDNITLYAKWEQEDPIPTTKPTETGKPNQSEIAKTDKQAAPKTGESMNLMLPIMFIATAVLLVLSIIVIKKKEQDKT